MSEEKTLMDFAKQAKSQLEEIDELAVNSLLDEGYQVIDVREPAEFIAGTIKGAFIYLEVYWNQRQTVNMLVVVKS
jgi:rhodanese-related sulfurtransferase